MASELRQIKAVARMIDRPRVPSPTLGLVLGSGFGGVADAIEVDRSFSYRELPGFPVGTVHGHSGRLLIGTWHGVAVALLCGRAHFYEGFDLAEVTFPVRALAALGVKALVLTNAAGGINRRFRPGDFMAATDHINFMGANPLRPNRAAGVRPSQRARVEPALQPVGAPTRFLDLTEVYDAELRLHLRRAARSVGARLHEGVYLAVSGPSYETPAEIRAFARLGADAVGMSTVPEAIVARDCGLRVAALSCITNRAAGLGVRGRPLSHREVLETSARVERVAVGMLGEFVRRAGSERVASAQFP